MRPPSLADKPRQAAAGDHPSGDRRFKMLDGVMKRHQYQQDALIEVLHAAQGLFGYLEDDVLLYVAHSLKLPPSRVYGVATFYHIFSLKPQGKHTCVVCMGTACYVRGAAALLAALEGQARVHVGETTPDGQLSLLTARCLGACGIAPAAVWPGTCALRPMPSGLVGHRARRTVRDRGRPFGIHPARHGRCTLAHRLAGRREGGAGRRLRRAASGRW